MDNILMESDEKIKKAIEIMEHRFSTIRAGRANPAILDSVFVSYYDVETPLKQLASISVPEARQLIVKPFDKTILGAIEKAIYEANIGLTPNNNGEIIILNIPVLTEETRRDYVKQVKAMSEECKVALRKLRQDANDKVKKMEVSEDEIKLGMDEVQKLIDKYNLVINEKLKLKEEELMTI